MSDKSHWANIASRVRTETFIRHTEWHDELGSTNDRALALAVEKDLPVPALVATARQTAGRGRAANVWRSGPGALTFSLIVERPLELPIERTPIISLVAGLAVRQAIAACVPAESVKIKWPNDIYVDGRKVCGILTEIPPRRSARIVIGIGINVNNSLDEAPPDVRRKAVSLSECTGKHVDIGDLLVSLLIRLQEELSGFVSTGSIYTEQWSRYCLLTDRQIRLRLPAGEISGRCLGVTDNGMLIIQSEEHVNTYASGEILEF